MLNSKLIFYFMVACSIVTKSISFPMKDTLMAKSNEKDENDDRPIKSKIHYTQQGNQKNLFSFFFIFLRLIYR